MNTAILKVGKDLQAEVQAELTAIAAPIRDEAQVRALGQGYGIEWSRMRVGQTSRSVYVVPVDRGTKVKSMKRPKFARLMLSRAMRPALQSHAAESARRLDAVVARVTSEFNRGA